VIERAVWVTHRFVGFHAWPDAPAERAYLRARHRHLFHVRAELDVAGADREVEFHDLLELVSWHCGRLPRSELGSCESIAELLAGAIHRSYPGRRIAVDVSEDGEAGARVELKRAS
jgi:hypothetical protein